MSHNKEYASDNDKNIALYTSLLREHGRNFKALDWGSKTSQELRFKVISEVGVENGSSVLDVGCGLGDFCDWFIKKGIIVKYTGIDVTPDMIHYATERYPAVEFLVGSGCDIFLNKKSYFDFVTASGIFAHRQENPLGFLKKTVQDMYDISTKGIAFNCLSNLHSNKDLNEFYADPLEIIKFCQSLSNSIIFRHDYHHGDFTIYLYKQDAEI